MAEKQIHFHLTSNFSDFHHESMRQDRTGMHWTAHYSNVHPITLEINSSMSIPSTNINISLDFSATPVSPSPVFSKYIYIHMCVCIFFMHVCHLSGHSVGQLCAEGESNDASNALFSQYVHAQSLKQEAWMNKQTTVAVPVSSDRGLVLFKLLVCTSVKMIKLQIREHLSPWSRCHQVSHLHISGSEVNISFKLFAERSDNGQTDALVTSSYHGNSGWHVCRKRERHQCLNSTQVVVKLGRGPCSGSIGYLRKIKV